MALEGFMHAKCSLPGGQPMRFETLAVHAGGEPDAETGAIAPPLHLSTTFQHAADGTLDRGWIYQRYDNPTQARLEAALAALDGASRSLFFSTGITFAVLQHRAGCRQRAIAGNSRRRQRCLSA